MPQVTGYVLAGGRSSRMGQDKALLELGGETLLERAASKLREVCGEVYILGANPAFAAVAPLLPDLHPDCGPIGGLEAALSHCRTDWALILPVDLPSLPSSLLRQWVTETIPRPETRLALFTVDGIQQPTLLLIHRYLLPYLRNAVEAGRYKLYPVLCEAAADLAAKAGDPAERVLRNTVWTGDPDWFANVNTPEEFAAVRIAAASERE